MPTDDETDFETALQAAAHAYVTFATRDAALLELMFAGKHAEPVESAAERAFEPVLGLITRGQRERLLERGDPERVGLMLLSTIHGTAALHNAGIVGADQLEWLVDDAITHFLKGSRIERVEAVDVA